MTSMIHNQSASEAIRRQFIARQAAQQTVQQAPASAPARQASRPAPADGSVVRFDAPASPAGGSSMGPLSTYLAQPKPNEASPPVGLERHAYGATPAGSVALVPTPPEATHLVGGIGTPPEIAKMREAGIANVFNPEWRAALDKAIQANGGLGNAQEGYLAFSKKYGFVRLRNTNLTPEQNRQLAAMSLQTGWAIERLPGRNLSDSSITSPKVDGWVNKFLGKYDAQFTAFLQDPSKGIKVKDGSRNQYLMQFDPQSGRAFSATARMAGGFKGFVQKNMKWIGPIMDVVSVGLTAFGFPYAAAGLQTAKQGLVSAATGKFTAGQAFAIAGSFLGASGPLSGTTAGQVFQNSMVQGGLNLAGKALDGQKIGAADVVGALAPSIFSGLPGGAIVDQAAQAGAKLVAAKIDGRDLSFMDFFNAVKPVLFGVDQQTTGKEAVTGLASLLGMDPTTVQAWKPLVGKLTSDPHTAQVIESGLSTLAQFISTGQVSPNDALGFLASVFQPQIDRLKADVKESLGLPSAKPTDQPTTQAAA